MPGAARPRDSRPPEAFAHTSAVYVEVAGRPVRSPEDAEYFIRWIQRLRDDVRGRDRIPAPQQAHVEAAAVAGRLSSIGGSAATTQNSRNPDVQRMRLSPPRTTCDEQPKCSPVRGQRSVRVHFQNRPDIPWPLAFAHIGRVADRSQDRPSGQATTKISSRLRASRALGRPKCPTLSFGRDGISDRCAPPICLLFRRQTPLQSARFRLINGRRAPRSHPRLTG